MNAQEASISGKIRRRLNPSVASEPTLRCRAFLDANLYGQQAGKDLLTYAYANAFNPLRDRTKPIAFIINAGKSRTGKTHSVELLAELVHGNPKAYQRIDMAEYMDKYSISNLKGSGRGYINNQSARDDGYKVSADQKHDYAEFTNHNLEYFKRGSDVPVSIVLLDELDKACAEVFLILLGIMDHGKLTLGNGEVVDFTNTIFVCACNLGMADVEREEVGGIGFSARGKKLNGKEVKDVVLKALRDKAPPEFRNRVNELGGIAIYEELTRDQMESVVVREVSELQKRINGTRMHFTVEVLEAARKLILDKALANEGNLANVKSVLRKEIENALGNETTKREIRSGDTAIVDVEDGVFVFDVEPAAERASMPHSSFLSAVPTGKPAGDAADSTPVDEVDASVFEMGALLGLKSNVFVLMRKAPERKTGELAVDQLMALGMMPTVPDVFTSLHSFTMVERMGELRFKAERFPELRAAYTIELTNDKHYQQLNTDSQELVQEITRLLGVEIMDSHMTHKAPFKFVINVQALPESIQLIKMRFPKLVIKPRA
ncbi:MAG: ATP-dependent Clp protease ATP-binding subunit [Candidatus Obscuribacter sp.]|nr:ATP-dependent Clp protease ATP-binding subunit [Candidatus Obscuribacter sp.]